MVLVAVAGGTSPSLGRSIVRAILATGKHEVIILSRANTNSTSSQTGRKSKYGAPIHYVDYESPESLNATLAGVDTLISVLKLTEHGAMLTVHTQLLAACQRNRVSRFIMSDWSMSTASHQKVDALANKAELIELCEQENNRADSHVACSSIQVGMFMNYFAQGSPRINSSAAEDSPESKANDEIIAGLVDDFMLEYIDISKGHLLMPTTSAGQPAPVSMTHILDIGRLVALSLSLPATQMRGPLGLVSQTSTFSHVHSVLESKCGMRMSEQIITLSDCTAQAMEQGSKSVQAMERGDFDYAAFMGHMVAQMMAFQCEGEDGGAVVSPTLNEMLEREGLLEGVKLWNVDDVLVKAWAE